LLPPAVTLVVGAALLPVRGIAPIRIAAGVYGMVLVGESVRIAKRSGAGREAAWLPAVFAAMHLSWGAGFLVGCTRFGFRLEAIGSALRPR
jgi:hypothetical protein